MAFKIASAVKPMIILVGFVCLIPLCYCLWLHWLNERYAAAFGRLEIGTSKDEVIERFGKPSGSDVRSPGFISNNWDGAPAERYGRPVGKPVEEFAYGAPFMAEEFVIAFDEQGKVVAKNHLISP